MEGGMQPYGTALHWAGKSSVPSSWDQLGTKPKASTIARTQAVEREEPIRNLALCG